MSDKSWNLICRKYRIYEHDFAKGPFILTAAQIKEATKRLPSTGEREVRILCKQDSRADRPKCFRDRNLFLLPIRNGEYAILEGEGYVDIPPRTGKPKPYKSKLKFDLLSSKIGDSEMQHLDKAYASSVLRTFMGDPSLVLTIRGRKYTPGFHFHAGSHRHQISTQSVQTEVDGGYEGTNQIVLVEAKNSSATDTIIRQLYYPMRQWSVCGKKVRLVFFEHQDGVATLREFFFKDQLDYHSIQIGRQESYLLA
ncbi:MAG: hypothetical protein NT115_14135 [Proteobacteria bacterium]|nr:hypothetical protein [Pseudomonadota bacterium]